MCEDGGNSGSARTIKKIYDQMMKNPNVGHSMTSPEYITVRISGKVEVFEGSEKKVFGSSALVQEGLSDSREQVLN